VIFGAVAGRSVPVIIAWGAHPLPTHARRRGVGGGEADHRRLRWQADHVDEETVERVREAVRAIPPGETASYGEIAERVGLRSARLVGRILSEDGHDLPWHRVLRADGTCAPHIAEEQSARLRAEGILMVDGRLPKRR
jgi:methylated-DNA-protein-cysteine methyltransferase-like protein